MLDAGQMREMTGSALYVSGLHTPGTVMLQPAGYVRGLGAGLARHVEIYENTPATGFTPESGGWRVAAPKGSVSAARVILTVNGHLESFGFARGRLMQLFLFASMTPELDEEQLATPWRSIPLGCHAVGPDGDNRAPDRYRAGRQPYRHANLCGDAARNEPVGVRRRQGGESASAQVRSAVSGVEGDGDGIQLGRAFVPVAERRGGDARAGSTGCSQAVCRTGWAPRGVP